MDPVNLTEDGVLILPQPDEISKREKEDAMGSYLMMFAAMGAGLPLPLLNLLAAIIYFFVNKKKSRFVAFHSFQSLITQIPISVLNAGLLFWIIQMLVVEVKMPPNIFWGYLLFTGLWNLVYTIYSIVACVKAAKGKFFYMLLFGRLVFNAYYGEKARLVVEKVETNAPPKGF